MQIPAETLSKFEEAVIRAKKIFITPHKSPDGDALGASIALYLALTRAGKDVVLACIDPVPDVFRFLPGSERFVQTIRQEEIDLVISVDAGDMKQLGWDKTEPKLFDGSRTIIKVDHHPFAQDFGDIKLVFTEAPASCFIVTKVLDALGIAIRPDMATCLLNGLYTDTGSFKHSNTSPEVLRMASYLMKRGANLPVISRHVFHSTPVSTMRLWGRVLDTLKLTKNGVALAVALAKDFNETEAKFEELQGVVDYVNAVPDSKFSLLLSERNGQIKASLRTKRDDVNVAKIASVFGGGGHVKAAGFAVSGRLEEETRWKVVN